MCAQLRFNNQGTFNPKFSLAAGEDLATEYTDSKRPNTYFNRLIN